ncbi:hypothetical protein [Methylocucumis oryzae]|nr:hypothetical protein [Methylocucumis oryzae]
MLSNQQIEHAMERLMYASRWILAPIYLGMSLIISALLMGVLDKLTKH